MEFWIVAEGVRRRFGTEMDHLEASGELEDYILFWVNIPVLDFTRDFSSEAHLQDRSVLHATIQNREMSCTFSIQFTDSDDQNVLDVFLRRLSL